MADQFETAAVKEMADVALAAGEKVVQTDHVIPSFEESFAKM